MIRFFRFSGPLQFGILFLLIWLFRLPLFFTDAPLMWQDVKNLALGEKLAEGFLLYRDVIDSSAPFSASVYWFLHILFGHSLLALYIVSGLLLFAQAQAFKWICSSNDILSDKGDIPALVYVVVACSCFDFMSLSPAFISLTFILIALNSVFKQIKSQNNEGEIFATGLYLGLAYLSFAPTLIYLLLACTTFLLFTRTNLRHYLLFFTGFLFPILFCLTFFYVLDGYTEFVSQYLFQFPAVFDFKVGFDWKIFAFIAFPSVLLALVGIVRAVTYSRFIIYQVISQRIMFIWLLTTILIVTIFFKNLTTAFSLLIPFLAFFITHFFQLMKKKQLGGYLMLIFMVYNLRMLYSYTNIPYLNKSLINFNNQIVVEGAWNKKFEHKRVWVIGNELSLYINNSIATGYFDFNLSKSILAHPEFYVNVNHIYHTLSIDMPEVIIDKEGLLPAIMEKIPLLKNHYYMAEKGVYLTK